MFFSKSQTNGIFPSPIQDQAQMYREQCLQEASPAPMRTNIDHICTPEGLLTPPGSLC